MVNIKNTKEEQINNISGSNNINNIYTKSHHLASKIEASWIYMPYLTIISSFYYKPPNQPLLSLLLRHLLVLYLCK